MSSDRLYGSSTKPSNRSLNRRAATTAAIAAQEAVDGCHPCADSCDEPEDKS